MNEEVLLRLSLAILFGALIGVERQWHHKNAGIRTHSLVAAGAAAFAIIAQRGLVPGATAAQIAAGVVTGIGFIGGGVIMRRGGSVQGINTAATLWATGSLGLAVGGGYYDLAGAVLIAILAAQIPLRWLAQWIDGHSRTAPAGCSYRLMVAFEPQGEKAIRAALAELAATGGVSVADQAETWSREGVLLEARITIPMARAPEIRALAEKLAGSAGVTRAEWSRSPDEEPE